MAYQVTTSLDMLVSPNTTTILPDNSSACLENVTESTEYQSLLAVTHTIKQFYIWIVFAFGFPGNIFCVITVIKMSRQRPATSLFLVGLLAVVDNITIILKLIENQSQNQRFHMNGVGCKLLFFLGLTCANYANWILISLAVERYIAVRYPLRIAAVWSLRKAGLIISVVFLFMCVVHLHLLWTVTDSSDGFTCRLILSGSQYQAWFYVGSFLYAILPACFLIPGNIFIIRHLRKSANRRQALTETSQTPCIEKQDRQITAMLVIVAAVFVILSFPRCIYTVAHPYWHTQKCSLDRVRKYFLNVLSSNIADTNHAVNFCLYFLAGKRFRDAYRCHFRFHGSNSSSSNK